MAVVTVSKLVTMLAGAVFVIVMVSAGPAKKTIILKSDSRRGQVVNTWGRGHRCYGSCRERLDASYGRCWGCVSEVPKYCVSYREENERTPLGRGDLRAAVYTEMIVVVSSMVLYCVRVAAERDTVVNTVDGASV